MYHSFRILAGTIAVALATASCSEGPTAPDTLAFDADLVAMDDYGFTWGSGPGPGCATGPGTCFGTGAGAERSYLGGLVRQAYEKLLADQGKDAADAAFATLWSLHQDAFALRSSGDQAAFVTAMAAAHQESVRLVVTILGTGSAPTIVALAVEKLAALQALIAERQAAGADVTALQRVAATAADYLAKAQAALAAGDGAAAIDFGSRALQAATVGGGQNGKGLGTGSGTQVRYRGGR